MSALLGKFEEAIASLMPAHEAERYRAQLIAQREQEAKAAEMVRTECADALELIAGAIRRPSICRADLERALTHLHRALSAAAVLDPE